jgi:quercetin dioxygenase-like cupin family protein
MSAVLQTRFVRPGEGRSVWVAGDRYTTRLGGAETGGAFALIEAEVPPGHGPPPHVHTREDESFYVVDGSIEFHADGESFRGTPGSWVVLAKGSRHYFRNVGDTTARMLILVAPAGLERYFDEVGREDTGAPGESDFGPAELGRLLEAAPRYGLRIDPPGGEA